MRSANDESVLVLHNLSKSDVTFSLPDNLKEYSKVAFKNKNATHEKQYIDNACL